MGVGGDNSVSQDGGWVYEITKLFSILISSKLLHKVNGWIGNTVVSI